MSLNELQVISGFIERAECPEDVFGSIDGGSPEKQLKKAYLGLVKALHPDRHSGDPRAEALAKDLFQQIEDLHTEAKARIARRTYGRREILPSKMPLIIKSKYVRNSSFCAGDIADLHVVSVESSRKRGNLLMKIARNPADNDLLKTECEILNQMHEHKRFASSKLNDAVPTIVDSFILDDGRKRRVNVMNRYEGFIDGVFVRQRFPIGVDGRTIAWMWKRLLVLLEWTYKLGFVHGAVLPPHVLFYPDNDGNTSKIDDRKHSIRLVDWCYAVPHKSRTRLSAWIPGWEHFYAPEILKKEKLGPWTDLYMGAQTMLYLSGGYPPAKSFPDSIPAPIIESLKKCLRDTPSKRPQDIGEYFDEFVETIRKVYGARRWHEFNVPGI